MKTACWTLALLLACACVGSAAAPPAPPTFDLARQTQDFERNVALGTALSMRAGTPAEIEELRALADQGLTAARQAVAAHPEASEAHYLLGSWLLYGYRVVDVRQVSHDPELGGRADIQPQVVLGLSDDPDEGLQALRRATELAPDDGDYLLDYAAALGDCGQITSARGILKAAWGGQPALDLSQRMRAAALLSDAEAAQGDLAQAREWAYLGLDANPENAGMVEYLRWLQQEEAAAALAAAARAAERRRLVLLPQCPFELVVGGTIYLADSWGGDEWGFEDITQVPGTNGAEVTVGVCYADDWQLSGVGGALLEMAGEPTPGFVLQNSGLWVRNQPEQQSGSVEMAERTTPPYIVLRWQDQPFQISKGDLVIGEFADTADYVSRRGGAGSSPDSGA